MSAEILLRNQWYLAALSREVPTGQSKAVVICGEPYVLFRNSEGRATALRDICPHRGIPLSYGQVVKGEIECPYHGWTFDSEGTCTSIPSLCSGQDLDCRKIKVKHFEVDEFQGMIWIFIPEAGAKKSDLPLSRGAGGDAPVPPRPPRVSFLPNDRHPKLEMKVIFPCSIDHAVIGLMDPAHGPYVHKSWFWRSSRSSYEKKKLFKPIPFGFKMARHEPSKNSKAYRFFGGEPTTEIAFQLPATRWEHVIFGRRNFCSYTALTPIDDKNTQVTQLAYWDSLWFSLAKPFIYAFAKVFLGQDMRAVTLQQDGLKYDPSLMLIKDADTQARWYFRMKAEWSESEKTKRPFENPVTETELRWRS